MTAVCKRSAPRCRQILVTVQSHSAGPRVLEWTIGALYADVRA